MLSLRRSLFVFLIVLPVFAFGQADQAIISVVDAPDPVLPGNTLTYTITAQNNGPNPAVNGGINLLFDGNFTPTSVLPPAGFSCTSLAQIMTCNNPSWAPGAPAVFVASGTVASHLNNFPDGTLTSSFTTSGVTPDPNSGNNSSGNIVTSYNSPQMDLSVAVTDNPDPVTPDNNITYTVDVTNAGPDAATSVNFNAFNNGTLRYQSITIPTGWSCPSQPPVNGTPTFTCTRALFAAGTSQFIVVVKADSTVLGINDGSVGQVFNVNGTGDDTNDNNNQEIENTAYVTPDADIEVAASDSPDPVFPDGDITYTVTVRNAGPDTASNVVLSVPLNNTLRFQSISIPAGWSCSPPAVGSGTSFSCSIASLPVQPASTFTIVLRANDEQFGINDTTINQVFSANSGIADPDNTDNVVNVSTAYVTPDANTSITATDSPDPVTNGGTVTFTIIMTNAGPDAAPNAQMIASPHPSLVYQSMSNPAGWSCTTPAVDASGPVVCTMASMPNGSTANFTLVTKLVTSGAGGVLDSDFASGSSAQDPVPSNNNIEVLTNWVGQTSDLALTKSTLSTAAAQGSTITYTISTTNNGPDAAAAVTVTDVLPASLLFQSITVPAGWSCTTPAVGANGTITCSAATLANGATASFTLVTTVAPNATGAISNTATTGSANADPTPGNSSGASGAVAIAGNADLGVTKTTVATSVAPGAALSYTITVTNGGPEPAASVTMSDTLPASLLFQSIAAPAGWSCTTPAVGATGTITCTAATLANGALATFTLNTTVASNATGTVTNSASASHSGPDGSGSNNSGSSSPTPVTAPSADLHIAKTTATTNITVGTVFTYVITVTNAGPGSASAVTVNDTLPAGLELVAATPSQGTCNAVSPLQCSLGGIAPGGNATVSLQVRAASPGTVTNTATVTAAEDAAPGNNSDDAPQVIIVGGPAEEAAIPTLSEWSLIALMMMLALVAALRMRS